MMREKLESLKFAKVLAGLAMVLIASQAMAVDPVVQQPVVGQVAEKGSASQEVKEALAQQFPKFQTREVNKTPINGLYEIIAAPNRKGAGDNVIYFDPTGGHLIFGEIYSRAGINLTGVTKERMMRDKIADIDLTSALKIGDGPNIVIEVTDPDCPYCRKGSKFLEGRDDMTRYVFFTPLPMHPKAPQKCAFILSSENSEQAMIDVFAGKYDKDPLPEFTDNNKLSTHKMIAAKLEVRGTPAYWINGNFVNGANTGAMERLLNQPTN